MKDIPKSFWALYAIVFLAISTPTLAWDLTEGIAPTVQAEKVAPFFTILVVSADTLNEPPHNNANPPRGIFTIHECLRGHVKGPKAELGWRARSKEEDHVQWSSDMPEGWQRLYWERPCTDKWNSQVLPTPPMGERIIVYAMEDHRPMSPDARRTTGWVSILEIGKNIAASKRLPYFEVRAAFAFTESNRQTVAGSAGPTDRDPRIQSLLIRLLLGCAPLGPISFGVAFGVARRKRFMLWGSTIGVALLSILLWIVYETGNVTGGIRIDLFIILPLLALNLLTALAAVVALIVTIWKKRGANNMPEDIRR